MLEPPGRLKVLSRVLDGVGGNSDIKQVSINIVVSIKCCLLIIQAIVLGDIHYCKSSLKEQHGSGYKCSKKVRAKRRINQGYHWLNWVISALLLRASLYHMLNLLVFSSFGFHYTDG